MKYIRLNEKLNKINENVDNIDDIVNEINAISKKYKRKFDEIEFNGLEDGDSTIYALTEDYIPYSKYTDEIAEVFKDYDYEPEIEVECDSYIINEESDTSHFSDLPNITRVNAGNIYCEQTKINYMSIDESYTVEAYEVLIANNRNLKEVELYRVEINTIVFDSNPNLTHIDITECISPTRNITLKFENNPSINDINLSDYVSDIVIKSEDDLYILDLIREDIEEDNDITLELPDGTNVKAPEYYN